MRDYGRVHGTFWSSPTTSHMTDKGKLLALYLMTCTHGTIAGVFRLPDGYIAEDLQWETEEVREAFGELLEKGFADRCETTKWVWLVKHLEWNPPENPNQRKAAVKVASGVPASCSWRHAFLRDCGASLGLTAEQEARSASAMANPFATVPVTVAEPVSVAVAVAVAETEAVAVVDAAKAVSSKKGTRLPKDWVLPNDCGDWALDQFPSWTADMVRAEAEKFVDYWTSKTGPDATKLDWAATWRNWCRNVRTPAPRGRVRASMTDEQRAALDATTNAEAKALLFGGTNATTLNPINTVEALDAPR